MSEFQWKRRGSGTGYDFSIFFLSIVSITERRGHESGTNPVVMGRLQNHRFEVREDRCFGCGACIALCPVHVLRLEQRMVYVDEPNCTHCRLCIPSCPVFALELTPCE
ncbi:MAG: 4Fe-4S dicluster domain-containing protein [Candidatus Poseidoniales archaeon]|nr:MAG: 4Fe-4S dicluster domain-containing protein [Candidatus Poseidoniales archaeon]